MYDAATVVAVIAIVAAVIFLPKLVGLRLRLWIGIVLFIVGWGGVLLGLSLSDEPFFQSEVVAYAWIGIFGVVAAVLAPVFIVSAVSGWLKALLSRPSGDGRPPQAH